VGPWTESEKPVKLDLGGMADLKKKSITVINVFGGHYGFEDIVGGIGIYPDDLWDVASLEIYY
jgi:hypothetical protein